MLTEFWGGPSLQEFQYQCHPSSPTPHPQLKQTMKAFIDDVNIFIGKPANVSDATFLQEAQEDINCWHVILHATGGELNTKKCFWSDVNHSYNKQGTPHICQPMITNPQLLLTNQDGTSKILHSTKPHEGLWHLGVHISMNRNNKVEERTLINHCQVFQKVFHWCPLMHAEAEVTYKTIFLSTITYPFPATNLSATILEKAQSMTTPVILSHMGYNQNMPKAVVYALTTVGGLGFHHLSTEQGLQKIIHLI